MQIVYTQGMIKMEKVAEQGVKTLTFLVLGNVALQLFMYEKFLTLFIDIGRYQCI